MGKFLLTLLILIILGAFAGWYYLTHAMHAGAHYSLSTIEIADTTAKRVEGLSGRDPIPDDYGMLFIFPSDKPQTFWMKDMKEPIDMIWIADDGSIAGITANVAPSTYPETFPSPEPVRYVLETRAGLARDRGWATSTALALPLR
jgi:uncharacterized membrane protein (UPF0127 family)